MFTWVNHNSLYILIFIFPFLISLLSYIYLTKNKIIIFSIFFFLLLAFLILKNAFVPQESLSLDIASDKKCWDLINDATER